ncbi:VWA domain-containing protein [Desulfovibrio sp. OttesenSCG-928-M16]|nr:VWA domain-containing protein [Desulfovibrio sp. OttesenSCG-928-M16]
MIKIEGDQIVFYSGDSDNSDKAFMWLTLVQSNVDGEWAIKYEVAHGLEHMIGGLAHNDGLLLPLVINSFDGDGDHAPNLIKMLVTDDGPKGQFSSNIQILDNIGDALLDGLNDLFGGTLYDALHKQHFDEWHEGQDMNFGELLKDIAAIGGKSAAGAFDKDALGDLLQLAVNGKVLGILPMEDGKRLAEGSKGAGDVETTLNVDYGMDGPATIHTNPAGWDLLTGGKTPSPAGWSAVGVQSILTLMGIRASQHPDEALRVEAVGDYYPPQTLQVSAGGELVMTLQMQVEEDGSASYRIEQETGLYHDQTSVLNLLTQMLVESGVSLVADQVTTWVKTLPLVSLLPDSVIDSLVEAVLNPEQFVSGLSTDELLYLPLPYVTMDGDGDIAVNLTFHAIRDSEPVKPSGAYLELFGEKNLPDGTDTDTSALVATATFEAFNFGFDGPDLKKPFTWDEPNPNIYRTNNVDADGNPIYLKWEALGGDPAKGWVGLDSEGKAVITVASTFAADGDLVPNGYTVTLHQPLENDKPGGANDDKFDLDFGFTLQDADGDTVSGNLKVSITDDGPLAYSELDVTDTAVALSDVELSAVDGFTWGATGNILLADGNVQQDGDKPFADDLWGADGRAEGDAGLSVFAADGSGVEHKFAADTDYTQIAGKYGTLFINGQGEYKYVMDPAKAASAATPITVYEDGPNVEGGIYTNHLPWTSQQIVTSLEFEPIAGTSQKIVELSKVPVIGWLLKDYVYTQTVTPRTEITYLDAEENVLGTFFVTAADGGSWELPRDPVTGAYPFDLTRVDEVQITSSPLVEGTLNQDLGNYQKYYDTISQFINKVLGEVDIQPGTITSGGTTEFHEVVPDYPQEIFHYILTDADGDQAPATLTINTNPPTVELDNSNLVVDESFMVGGSGVDTGGPGEASSATDGGSFTVTNGQFLGLTVKGFASEDADAKTDISVNAVGETTVYSEHGVLVLTAVQNPTNGSWTVSYEFTVTKAYDHTPNEGPDQKAIAADSFVLKIGGIDVGTLGVDIEDDAPLAHHDLNVLETDGVHWIAGGNVLTSAGSDYTAENTGSSPSWVKVGDGPKYNDTFGADTPETQSVTSFTYTKEDGTPGQADIPANGDVTVTVNGGGTLTMYSDGAYKYEAPYSDVEIVKSDHAVEFDIRSISTTIDGKTVNIRSISTTIDGETVDGKTFDFQALKNLATLSPDADLSDVLKDTNKASLVDGNNHTIGVASGIANDVTGAIDKTEALLINTMGVYTHGLNTLTLTLGDYNAGTDSATLAIFDVYGNRLGADDYKIAWEGNKVIVTMDYDNASSYESIGYVLLTPGQGSFSLADLSGSYQTEHIKADTASPVVEITYTIMDSDGDTSSALLRLEKPEPSLVVGSDYDDRGNAVHDYTVTDNNPATPDHGNILGGTENDILVGDASVLNIITSTPKNYNICVVLDTSGSMDNPSGDENLDRLALAQAALKSLLNQLADYSGNVNIKLVSFAATADGTRPAIIEVDSTNYKEAIGELISHINTLNHTGATNYEGAFDEVKKWFTNKGETDAGNPKFADYVNKVLFLTDGNPTITSGTYVDGNTTSQDEFNISYTAYQRLINSVDVEVSAIGIGAKASGLSLDLLDYFDNTTNSGFVTQAASGTKVLNNTITTGGKLYGETEKVNTASDLTTVMEKSLALEEVIAGNDVVLGGAGNDILFGDVMNTDKLAQDKGVQLPDGSGWHVFATLEADTGANAAWDRNETVKYIQENLAELGEAAGATQGGHDLLIGGTGNDTIYGQDGNDVIVGGDLNFADKHGQDAYDALIGSAHANSETAEGVAAYLKEHFDQIGDGTAADGNNHLYGGVGNDIIIGGGGNDLIVGGEGDDIMFGGAGSDTFAVNTSGGHDVIMDFTYNTTEGAERDVLSFEEILGSEDPNALGEMLSKATKLTLTADDVNNTLTLEINDTTVDIHVKGDAGQLLSEAATAIDDGTIQKFIIEQLCGQ